MIVYFTVRCLFLRHKHSAGKNQTKSSWIVTKMAFYIYNRNTLTTVLFIHTLKNKKKNNNNLFSRDNNSKKLFSTSTNNIIHLIKKQTRLSFYYRVCLCIVFIITRIKIEKISSFKYSISQSLVLAMLVVEWK
jgi:hypothetical protein